MSKKTVKITFKYGCETVKLKWKGFPYSEASFIDFLDRFLDLMPFDLEVRKRNTDTKKLTTKS